MVNRITFDDDNRFDDDDQDDEHDEPAHEGLLRCCVQALGRLNMDLGSVAMMAAGLPKPLRKAIRDASRAIEAAKDEAAFLADDGE